MHRNTLFCSAFVLMFVAAPFALAEKPTPFAERQKRFQAMLEVQKEGGYQEDRDGLVRSLAQFEGKGRIQIDTPGWKLKFLRDGRELFTIQGHAGSIFKSIDNVLYFAHYSNSTSGGYISAHDLSTGKQLWKTELHALGDFSHFGYSSAINIAVNKDDHPVAVGPGLIMIQGHETFGDYTEILDRETGKLLAHKAFVTNETFRSTVERANKQRPLNSAETQK